MCIDNNLSFKHHVKQIIRNVSHKVYILSKIRDKLTDKAAADVLKVMILPLLDYRDVFYPSASGQLLNKLRVLMNKALRIVAKVGCRENTDAIAKRLGMQTLEDRRLCHLLQLARWMSLTGKCVDHRKFNTRSHADLRRNMWVEAPRKSLFHISFVYKACEQWNGLPTEIQQIIEEGTYKRTIRNFIKQKREESEGEKSNLNLNVLGNETEK